MADARRRFDSAARRARALSAQPSSRELLELYALYKQATAGDVVGDCPHPCDARAHAKYAARLAVRGLGEREAKHRYVELVARLIGEAGPGGAVGAAVRDGNRGQPQRPV